MTAAVSHPSTISQAVPNQPGSVGCTGYATELTGRNVRGASVVRYCSSEATEFTVSARITAPKRNERSACLSATRRIARDVRVVSETWNVIPMVKAK